jgi:small-conductance mechanosensitive channel
LAVIVWLLFGAAFGSFAVLNDYALAQEASQPAAPSSSANGLSAELAKPVEELSKGIEAAEKALQHLKEVESELGQLRIDVEGILKGSAEAAEQLRPRLAAIKDQIGKLGPAPAKDAPAEPAAVATERARLNAEATAIEGAIKTAELTWVRARQLIERITVLRHSLFTRNLFERLSSPLLPSLWRHVTSELPAIQQRLSYLGNDWWTWARPKQTELALLIGGIILAYAIARLIVGRIARRAPREHPRSFIERAASAAWVAPMRAVPAALALLLLYGGLDALNLLYQPWDGLAAGITQGALLFIGIKTLLATVFGVREPGWRLFDLSDTSARRVCRLLQGIAAVFAIDLALTAMARAFFIPLGTSHGGSSFRSGWSHSASSPAAWPATWLCRGLPPTSSSRPAL